MRPSVNPHDRGQVVSTDRYRSGQLVWIWRDRLWREGVVLGASPRTVIVRYRIDGRGGQTDTDTVTAPYVMARDKVTPIDEGGGA